MITGNEETPKKKPGTVTHIGGFPNIHQMTTGATGISPHK